MRLWTAWPLRSARCKVGEGWIRLRYVPVLEQVPHGLQPRGEIGPLRRLGRPLGFGCSLGPRGAPHLEGVYGESPPPPAL
eukprot:464282-Pyramimonas_sp.AAC.1